MFRQLFIALSLTILSALPLWAVDRLLVVPATQAVPPKSADTTSGALLQVQPNHHFYINYVAPEQFKLPTPNHLTLIDNHGKSIPLLLDKSSFTYSQDRITALRIAFQLNETDLNKGPFYLVWDEQDVVGKNTLVAAFRYNLNNLSDYRSFSMETVAAGDSTVLIEIDNKGLYYRLWYLFPLLILATLLLVNRLWIKEVPRS